jgi:hypothetical protein
LNADVDPDQPDSTESWWPILHDADLIRFTSDLSARTASLEVRIDHLGDASGKGSSFSVVFYVVRAIGAAKWEPWALPDRELSDPERMGRRDWGRMVSLAPRDLSGPSLRIVDAALKVSSSEDLSWPTFHCKSGRSVQLLTLDIDGTGSETGALELSIVFERVEVLRDGEPITIDDFVTVGESYWEHWAERNRSPRI